MSDIHQRDIDANVSRFEAATEARRVEIPPVTLRRLLLALDGSNQDPTSEALARAAARRLDAAIHVTFAYEGAADADKDRYLAERARALAEEGLAVTHSRAEAAKPYQQILDLSARQECEMIVACAPYLDDFRELGTASVGTNLDMLLSRRPGLLLVVREPLEDAAEHLAQVVMPLSLLEPGGAEPLAWALRLLPDEGSLALLAVVDTETIEAARRMLGGSLDLENVQEAAAAGLTRPEMAGLIGAAQRRAAGSGLACQVVVREGELVPTICRYVNQTRCLIVTACPRQSSATGYQQVQTLIRESRNPVLVV
jgi:hypothetical protein